MSVAPSAISGPEFEKLVRTLMPIDETFDFGIEHIERGSVTMTLAFHEKQLRPGGTVSGPVLFTLADTALWAATLSVIGPVPLAVTSDISIRFLRRPLPKNMTAKATLLKSHGRLFVGEVSIFSEGEPEPVAHVTGTYAAPRSRPGQTRNV